MSEKNTIILRDPRTVNFFHTHPELDPDETVSTLLDVLECMRRNNLFRESECPTSPDTDSEKDETPARLAELASEVDKLRLAIAPIINSESRVTDGIAARILDMQRGYTEQLKQILACQAHEHTAPMIERLHARMVESLRLVAAEAPARHSEQLLNLEKELLAIRTNTDLARIERCFTDAITALGNRIAAAEAPARHSEQLLNLQKELIALRTNTDLTRVERCFTDAISALGNRVSGIADTQTALRTEIQNHVLRLTHNSSNKGASGEIQLAAVLAALFPAAEIQDTSRQTAACDFLLRRPDAPAPHILFENKAYSANVPKDEVAKFIRDATRQKQHAIFLSQHSGVASKQNYQVALHRFIFL